MPQSALFPLRQVALACTRVLDGFSRRVSTTLQRGGLGDAFAHDSKGLAPHTLSSRAAASASQAAAAAAGPAPRARLPGLWSLSPAQRLRRLLSDRQLLAWAAQSLSLLCCAAGPTLHRVPGVERAASGFSSLLDCADARASLEPVLSSLLAASLAVEALAKAGQESDGATVVRSETAFVAFHLDNAIQRLVMAHYVKLPELRFAKAYADHLQKFCDFHR
jgi:hypothetical protein